MQGLDDNQSDSRIALSLSKPHTVQVQALAGDTVLYSWARHLTLTVPLSTQEYNWAPAKLLGKPDKL